MQNTEELVIFILSYAAREFDITVSDDMGGLFLSFIACIIHFLTFN